MDDNKYTVTKIEGEYATLKNAKGDELFFALALLPDGADVGSVLRYDFPEFELLS